MIAGEDRSIHKHTGGDKKWRKNIFFALEWGLGVIKLIGDRPRLIWKGAKALNRDAGSILLLVCVGTLLFLIDPANSTFYTDDEWLYIGTAYEMYSRGELWITYWLGEPAYYKPPLAYWMMMPFFPFGQDPILQGRLAIGLMSLVTALLTWWIGKLLYGERQGLLAGLLSATSLGFLTYGRVGMLDMPFTLWLTLAVAFLVKAWQKKSAHWAGLFWAVAGFSVLVKGPVSAAILFLLCFCVALFHKAWRFLFFSASAWLGMFAAMLFTVAWPVALYFKGQFENWYQFFIITENLGKFGDPSVYPAGPFIAYALQWQLPWTVLLLAAILMLPFHRRIFSFSYSLPLVWAAAIILVYLIPRVRLPWYLLPVVPAASLLTAAMWSEYSDKIGFKISLRLTGFLLLIPAAVLAILAWTTPFSLLQRSYFILASLSLFAGFGFAWRYKLHLVTIAFAISIATLAQGVDSLTDGRLPQNVARELRSSNAPIAAARIETGRLSQQLWFFSYQLGRKVEESRGSIAINRFLSEQHGLLFISDTDLEALKKDRPDRGTALQVLHSWNYWKESIPPEDIQVTVLQGKIERLTEKIHVVRQ